MLEELEWLRLSLKGTYNKQSVTNCHRLKGVRDAKMKGAYSDALKILPYLPGVKGLGLKGAYSSLELAASKRLV